MPKPDFFSRRQQALDLLLHGKITRDQYERLVGEIETAEMGSRDTSDTHQSLHGMPTNMRQLAPAVGDVLAGTYRLVSQLGRGAFGVVWRAEQLDSNRDVVRIVAVKLLPPELQHDAVELVRVRSVFDKVHALKHPHLCQLIDFAEDDRFKAFLVMECLDYKDSEGNLRPYVTLAEYAHGHRKSHGDLSVAGVVKLLTPVASALEYIHDKPLVHRDLKPANILVRPPRKGLPLDVQIVDMGLAAEIRSSMSQVSRGSQDCAGTAPYMSPEQWRGQPLTRKSDQWALATIAYELLAGKLPFDCPNESAWMHCALNEPLPPSDAIPANIFQVLQQARRADPKARFESCVDFVKHLKRPADNPATVSKHRPQRNQQPRSESHTFSEPRNPPKRSIWKLLLPTFLLVLCARLIWNNSFQQPPPEQHVTNSTTQDNRPERDPLDFPPDEPSDMTASDQPESIAHLDGTPEEEWMSNIPKETHIEPAPAKEPVEKYNPAEDSRFEKGFATILTRTEQPFLEYLTARPNKLDSIRSVEVFRSSDNQVALVAITSEEIKGDQITAEKICGLQMKKALIESSKVLVESTEEIDPQGEYTEQIRSWAKNTVESLPQVAKWKSANDKRIYVCYGKLIKKKDP